MFKKILNGRLINVLLRIESVSYILLRQILVLWGKKTLIFGRNELSFRDQGVPRSRELQYSNIYEWLSPAKKHWVRFLSIDRWPEASTRDPTMLRSRWDQNGAAVREFFFLSHHRLWKITLHCFTKRFLAGKKFYSYLCIRLDSAAV